jgi:hypothetical protein
VRADFNDHVTKDQVLARIDPSTYQAQIAQGSAAVASARAALASADKAIETNLAAVDRARYGPEGVQQTVTASLLALEQMRRGVAPEQASAEVRRLAGGTPPCGTEAPVRLATTERLLNGLANLVDANQQASDALVDNFASDAPWRALRDSTAILQRKSQEALDDFDGLVTNAYRAERLAGIVSHACSTWTAADDVTGSLTEGRVVTVQVDSRNEPETARLAERHATTYKVQVLPEALIRPALAFAGVAVPSGRFSNYATQPITGGVQIYESGTQDERFSLGGSFALTWAKLDFRDDHAAAIWLPELVVTTGSNHGFGTGAAFSWNAFKLGAGVMWLRHKTLANAKVGDVVADASKMKLNDAYGKGQLYLSLSIIDWSPPALPGGGKK